MGEDRSTRPEDLWEFLLSFGAHPDETDERRGQRRIFVGALWYSLPFIAVFSLAGAVREGRIWIAVILWSIAAANLVVLIALKLYPRRYVPIQLAFVANVVGSSAIAIIQGGLIPSGVNNAWGLVSVLGAIVAVGIRAALFWFGAWIFALVATAVAPNWIEPIYEDPVSTQLVALS